MSKCAIPAIVRRVLARLSAAEAQESNPWLRDDIGIARLTLLHAARGDAVYCSPHVLASYEVLGLHPEKVWPAIQKRRLALGPLEAIGAPPKKPAQSVKLWPKKTNGARAVNSCAGETLLRDNTISAPMATPSIAAAYPNSDGSGSEKQRPFFTVSDIEKFFETCPEELLSRRFRHFLRGCWIAAGRPFGSEILLFKANEHYRRACYYKSERTVRYNRLAAEKLHLLEIVHSHHGWIRPRTERDKGLYRRVTTHRLPISLLLKWREMHRSQAHHDQAEVTPIRKPAAPVPPPLPPAPAAPLPRKVAEEKPRQVKLTRRQSAQFVADMAVLMRGNGKSPGRTEPDPDCEQCGGKGYYAHPGHPGMQVRCCWTPADPMYRPKLPWREALLAVCERWKRQPQAVMDALKFWGYQTEPEESA